MSSDLRQQNYRISLRRWVLFVITRFISEDGRGLIDLSIALFVLRLQPPVSQSSYWNTGYRRFLNVMQ